jgi:AraC family transcriptional regulator, regulatory protein of adaptative response / methylated-DNA-[protein]-cysteine methyltransferase
MVIRELDMLNEAECWERTLEKDPRYDGTFVVAVRSTGIYCRPSCPARMPRRENVRFYANPEEAEGAGFRACKRCSPNEQAFEAEVVERVCRYIDERLEHAPTLAQMGEHVSLSPYHLQRIFKRAMGITPRQYADARRLEQFKQRLRDGDSVTDAVYDAGYGSSSRVYERAPLGMKPSTYRRGGEGMSIGYSVVDCPLGRLLVGATERGVCSVELGDDDEALVKGLHDEYPAAELWRSDTSFREWVDRLLCYLSGEQPHLELPLDIQATAFQWRVWEALRAIPYGETRSYSEIAEAIGAPKAARAVARACATNPAAMVIPCHRVVREDGELGGYRWGMARKEALLKQEQHAEA